MTATEPAESTFHDEALSTRRRLVISVFDAHDGFVVHVSGELDVVTRNQLVAAATAGRHPHVLIDLGGVTFMDCGGYGSLVAARRLIQSSGKQLTITGQTGQPARFLDMLADLEEPRRPPLLNHRPAAPRRVGARARDHSVMVQVAFFNT